MCNRKLQLEMLESRRLFSAADIVFLLDESNSSEDTPGTAAFAEVLPWLEDNLDEVDGTLRGTGVNDLRYGLVGFGGRKRGQESICILTPDPFSARYFLPSADEWHKAAYYDPANDRYWLYPYGSDDPPVAVARGNDPGTAVYNQDGPADVQLAGGESPFGVVGMAGNVYDFEETTRSLVNDSIAADLRGVNGGSWIFTNSTTGFSSAFRNSGFVKASQPLVGIRVTSIPEPNTLLLVVGVLMITYMYKSKLKP